MTHKSAAVLAALSLVGATYTAGCKDSGTGEAIGPAPEARVELVSDVVPFSERQMFTSAATPLGWSDRDERRAAEEAFARGEDETVVPPNSIGGGPSLDE